MGWSSASPPGTDIARPLHIVSVTTGEKPAAMFVRNLIVVEGGARVTLVESHEGPAVDYQVNAACELIIGEGAEVDHLKIIGGRVGGAAHRHFDG